MGKLEVRIKKEEVGDRSSSDRTFAKATALQAGDESGFDGGPFGMARLI
jgi:hypothetical protein